MVKKKYTKDDLVSGIDKMIDKLKKAKEKTKSQNLSQEKIDKSIERLEKAHRVITTGRTTKKRI